MKYKGRNIDVVGLWSDYVEFPANLNVDEDDYYLPKVECPNPEHDTTKRHFQINARDGLVHCFAHCGISGSFEHAIAMIEGLYEKFSVDLAVAIPALSKKPRERSANEKEEIRKLGRARRQAGKIILKQAKGLATIKSTAAARKRNSSRSTTPVSSIDFQYETFLPPVALEYLHERKISDNSVSAWGLGWLPDEKRIVIPGRDENGRLRLLIKRGIFSHQQPKYLYTEGYPKSELLFGACQIDLGMVSSDGLILTEGSIDTIRLHQHGLRNSVAILGTGISEAQRRIVARIRPRKIYLFFDKDSAGIHNIEIAARTLTKYPLYVVRYPKGTHDPAELTKAEALRAISRAITLREFNSLSRKPRRKEISFG